MSRSVQFSIVSKQPMATILPVLMLEPRAVRLVVSAAMKQAVGPVERYLASRGIEVARLDDAPDHDLAAIHEFAGKALQRELDNGVAARDITLNATGGNKLMALGFIEAFRQREASTVVYADTQGNRLEFINPIDQPALSMASRAGLEDLLAGRGLVLNQVASRNAAWRKRAAKRRDVTGRMAELSMQKSSPLPLIRSHVSGSPPDKLRLVPRKRVAWLQSQGLLGNPAVSRDGVLNPVDESAVGYLKGEWLEEYLWNRRPASEEMEFTVGTRIGFDGPGASRIDLNELDLAVAYRNRLVLGECKVAIGKPGVRPIIDRLGWLKAEVIGPFGAVALVCPARSRDSREARRCRELGVAFAGREDMVDIGRWLERLIGSTV